MSLGMIGRDPEALDRKEYNEFCKANGKSIVIEGRYDESSGEFIQRDADYARRQIFENGALLEGSTFYDPPPEGSHKFLLIQREYHTAILNKEQADFAEYRNFQLHEADSPDSEAPKQLRDGRKRINVLKKKLKEINEKLWQTPTGKLTAEHNQQVAEREARDARLRNQIKSI